VASPAWGAIDFRGVFSGAPGDVLAGGVLLRASARSRGFGGHLLCGWQSSSSADLPARTGSYSLERWPCSLGVTARLSPASWRLEVDLDAGLVLGALRVAGHDLFADATSWRLETGGRIGLDALLHVGRGPFPLAPVLGIEATYLPYTYHVTVVPGGSLAEIPRLWLGVTAGASWALH
jgi:hypothetical protein